MFSQLHPHQQLLHRQQGVLHQHCGQLELHLQHRSVRSHITLVSQVTCDQAMATMSPMSGVGMWMSALMETSPIIVDQTPSVPTQLAPLVVPV